MDNRILVDFKNLHNLKGYAAKYLTTHALEDSEFSFTIDSNLTTDDIEYISYSLDNGETWITTQNINEQQVVITTPTVSAGNDVLWKGHGVCVGKYYINDDYGISCIFNSTGNYNVSGNYTSLIFDDYFVYVNKLSDASDDISYIISLFAGSTTIISAENLILPEYTILPFCYYQMFSGCSSLIKAPALPATYLREFCYMCMFEDCTALTTAPDLPATTLADRCYENMFYNCTSLTAAPALPATTLTTECYYYMFYNCTSLTAAPALPATTLTENCYGAMFKNCTALTTAPELSATTLKSNCYSSMFQGCTALTTAPELPATTLVSGCYNNMFKNCSNLNYIKALFTTTPSISYTQNWVQGVASQGTFVKNPAATWNVIGVNGIPTNWTYIESTYFITEAIEDCQFTFTNNNTAHITRIYYSYNNGQSWSYSTGSVTTNTVSAGNQVLWYMTGSGPAWDRNTSTYGKFSSSGQYNVKGNLDALFNNYTVTNNTVYTSFYRLFYNSTNLISAEHLMPSKYKVYYSHMFYGCTSLTTAPALPLIISLSYQYESMFYGCSSLITPPILQGDTANDYCCQSMFRGCTALVTAPAALPTTTLASYCYQYMFYGCTALTTPPALPATTLANYCYSYMFYGCTALTTAPELPATTLTNSCYYYMFQNCTALTTAPALPATTLADNCYSSMFRNCKKLTTAPELPATTLANSCYSSMFYTCSELIIPPILPATTLAKSCYAYMFYQCTKLQTAPILSATTLAQTCYDHMFYQCTKLTQPPVLPATTLANGCYQYMFSGCTLLTVTPLLPATTLVNNCYAYMFQNCTGLITVSTLPATTLAYQCYYYMFYGCSSLISVPIELPANTAAENSCQYMFFNCTSLTTAPELPAMKLENGCYSYMFYGCTGLLNPPALPAITLSTSCYSNMFYGCSSLTTAPELPAITLADGCYINMFYNCSQLNYINAAFITEPLTQTSNWVYGVASQGTFIKNRYATWDVTGINGIPTNWTIGYEDFQTEAIDDCIFTFTIKNSLTTDSVVSISYKLDTDTSWTTTNNVNYQEINITTPTVQAGHCVYWKGDAITVQTCRISSTGRYNIKGNITSLINNVQSLSTTYTFQSLFYNSTNLINSNQLLLPQDITTGCFCNMFKSCSSLITTPVLLTTNLAPSCYETMFYNCTSLITAPELPAITLASYCYQSMFKGCTSLTNAPELPAITLASYCYQSMFKGCTSLTNAPELPAMTLIVGCYKEMFRDCISLIETPHLVAIKLVNSCYNNMFQGCSNLSTITADFSTTPSSTYTDNWVSGVASEGTFYKSPIATWNVTGVNGIPTGWNVINSPKFSVFVSEAIDTCVFTLTIPKNVSGKPTSISYSIDIGNTWTTVDTSGTTDDFIITTPTISVGNMVLWKGTGGSTMATTSYYSTFSSSGRYNIKGNILAFISIPTTYIFYKFFNNSTNLINAYIDLSITTQHSYEYMFANCTSLVTPPTLSATELYRNCYYSMFYGCTSLTKAPDLPATALAQNCYSYMFQNCTALTTAPALPATTMFYECYMSMFAGCTSLTTAPELPATTLANECYRLMFRGCTALTTAHTLPATTLVQYCYDSMFYGCTALTTAPALPATILVTNCYYEMFYGCSNLNYIKALFTTTPSNTYTSIWVSGVASEGTFFKNPEAEWNVTGVNGVPENWEIITSQNYFTMEAIDDCVFTLTLASNLSTANFTSISYSLDDGNTWTTTNNIDSQQVVVSTPTITAGNKVLWKGNGNLFGLPWAAGQTCFSSTGRYNISGDINTLLSTSNIGTYAYAYLFYGSNNLISAENLILSDTLTNSCYYSMFIGCTSLTTAPELPATTLTNSCYTSMFRECTSLTTAPALPATTLAESCYQNMFNGCTSLTIAPELPATILTDSCYSGMFRECTSLTKAPELPANSTNYNYCYQYMFYGCTNLNYIKALFITYPNSVSMNQWVTGVAPVGTFVQNELATWDPVSAAGIPSGWVIKKEKNTPKYSDQYFTTTQLNHYGGDSFTVTIPANVNTDILESISYSKDGTAWTTTNNTDNQQVVINVTAQTGEFVYWKGVGTQLCTIQQGSGLVQDNVTFTASSQFKIMGNITSLLQSEEDTPIIIGPLFKQRPTLVDASDLIMPSTVYENEFMQLFYNCTGLTTAPVLPATTLAYSCYFGMFEGCSSLTTAPALPATTLAIGCYNQMFQNCSSLTTAPALPATILANHCYNSMFYGCTSLTTPPSILPAMTVLDYSYNSMFSGCSSLLTAPEISATTVSFYSCSRMFENCTSLTTAPTLSATTLGIACYQYMFNGCTSLTNVPASLPAMTMVSNCYNGMFYNCTSLTTAPALPATTLNQSCYQGMFTGCSSLTTPPSILPATILSPTCYKYMFFGCTSLTTAPVLSATLIQSYSCDSMFYNCTSLTTAPALPATSLMSYCYYNMFYNCESLVSGPSILPATTLSTGCYDSMFYNCKSLTTAPALPAITLTGSCYNNMFYNCVSLTTAPDLPATTLIQGCYQQMFYGCTNLSYINTQFTTTPGTAYTQNWVYGVAEQGIFVKNEEAEWEVVSPHGIPQGWSYNYEDDMDWPDATEFDYFAMETLQDNCVFTCTIRDTIDTLKVKYIDYSTDNGTTWVHTPNLNNTTITITTPQMHKNDTVLWRANAICLCDNTGTAGVCFSGSKQHNVKGNISSLIACNSNNSYAYKYKQAFMNNTNLISAENLIITFGSIGSSDCQGMFYNCTSLITAPQSLPATTLTDYCYSQMFYNCTSLITAPKSLPTTTLTPQCYQQMFQGCTSLTKTPALPATTLAPGCYSNMFSGCGSLTKAPDLPATTLVNGCYNFMFQNCSSLATSPVLPATTLGNGCYQGMFINCTSLTKAPDLPATTLATGCYESMFQGCTSLTTAPNLPATTLASTCYYRMFRGCGSLTKAPDLPATTLVNGCYNEMFYNCNNLRYIKALFITTPGSSYTNSWVSGVSSLGIFIKSDNATWSDVSSYSAAPYSWIISKESWPVSYNYFATQAIDNNCTFTLSKPQTSNTINYIEYSTDNGNTWTHINTDNSSKTITTPQIQQNQQVLWRAESCDMQNMNFSSSGRYKVKGNITSLVRCNYNNTGMNLIYTRFSNLFANSTNLISANELTITIDQNNQLSDSCYSRMFQNCTSLTTAPALPATSLAQSCYAYMFYGCTALTTAPALPATVCQYGCYTNMFQNCTSLTAAPTLPATSLAQSCYAYMFYGCTALTTAPELPAPALTNYCYNYMFYGCSNLNYINAAFTTTPNNTYTENWVYGVAGTGTFIKAKNADWDVYGPNAVPYNWTVPASTLLKYMWIDDFPGYLQMKDAVADPEGSGANEYVYSGDTITYNNKTCYIWNQNSDNGCPNMILTNTANLQTLQNQALDTSSFYAHFTALEAFMDDEETEYPGNDTKLNTDDTRLVSVYEEDNELHLWLDDFYYLEDYTYDDFINNPEQCGSNRYDYYGDTMEIDGDEYYVWEAHTSGDGSPAKVLTTTDDIDTLDTQSIKTSGEYTNFDAFFAALFADDEIQYDIDSDWGKAIQLIKIIENTPKEPIMGMWIDDFPDDNPDIISDYGSIEGAMDDAVNDPENHGSNLYIYYGDTFEYDGNTYYIWYHENYDDDFPFTALTTSIDLGELQNQSVGFTGNYNVQFTLLYAFGNIENDGNVYIQEDNDYDQVLLTVFEY